MRALKTLALTAALIPSQGLAAEGDWPLRGRVIDIALDKDWFLNIDPYVFGIGFGTRF